jgi:hypothetical protein
VDEGFQTHPAYIIVEFPDCKIPEDDNIMPDWPRTYIPITVYHDRCNKGCCIAINKGCCIAIQITSQVCKAITIHKSQGMYVGPNVIWKLIVVEFISAASRMRKPGLERVAFSRATGLEVLDVLDESEITYDIIMKIGTRKPYKKHREF